MNTFCTTPTAACNGVNIEYGSWQFIHQMKNDESCGIYAITSNKKMGTRRKGNAIKETYLVIYDKLLTLPVKSSHKDIPKLKTSAL